jgi:hypothetical protein
MSAEPNIVCEAVAPLPRACLDPTSVDYRGTRQIMDARYAHTNTFWRHLKSGGLSHT